MSNVSDPAMPLIGTKDTHNVVIYHANCPDGWLCAVLARMALGTDCVFEACSYGDDIRDGGIEEKYRGKNVYILDFSFPPAVLDKLSDVANTVLVLDHHKTFAESQGYPADEEFVCGKEDNITLHYSPDCCGAEMTLSYFTQVGRIKLGEYATILKWVVAYTGDRDLWKWKLQDSKAINEYFGMVPRTFGAWVALLHNSNSTAGMYNIVEKGNVALECTKRQVERLAKGVFKADITDKHRDIPVVNTQNFQSDLGHHLLDLYPEAPFVAMYYDASPELRKWSLRGRNADAFDCTTIAKQWGGGGHKSACGFETTPDNDPLLRKQFAGLPDMGE